MANKTIFHIIAFTAFFGAIVYIAINFASSGIKTNNIVVSNNSAKNVSEFTSNELVLFSNNDLIDAPPKTWQDLKSLVIRKKVEGVAIPIIALGRADNIAYAGEIFVALLKQENAVWPDDLKSKLGERALQFYNEFANYDKKVYTWNKSAKNSILEFSSGKVAMILAHFSDKEKFSNIKYSISAMPSISGSEQTSAQINISDAVKAILAEMIESVADNRTDIHSATQKAYFDITNLEL